MKNFPFFLFLHTSLSSGFAASFSQLPEPKYFMVLQSTCSLSEQRYDIRSQARGIWCSSSGARCGLPCCLWSIYHVMAPAVGSCGFSTSFHQKEPRLAPVYKLAAVLRFPRDTPSFPSLEFQLPLPSSGLEPSMAAASVLLSSAFLLCSWCTGMLNRLWTQTCVLGFSFYIFIILLCIGSGEAY